MRSNWLLLLHIIKMPAPLCKHDIPGPPGRLVRPGEEIVRKADLEIVARFYLGDVGFGELEAEGGDVGAEVRGFAPADDWEGVGCC